MMIWLCGGGVVGDTASHIVGAYQITSQRKHVNTEVRMGIPKMDT